MKTFINTALLKEQLKRFWPIAAMAMLWYLIFIVLPIYINAPNIFYARPSADMYRLLTMALNPVFMAMVAVPFCTVMALFSYPFKTASTAAFHSLPVNRNQLFFTNMLAGLLLMFVPLILLCLVLLIPVQFVEFSVNDWVVQSFTPGLAPGDVINTPLRVAGFLLRCALGFTLYFAVFTLAASLAGNRITAILLAAAIAITPTALIGLVELIGELYIFGLSTHVNSYIGTVTTHFHPVFWLRAFSWHTFGFGSGFWTQYSLYISYSLITLVAFCIAYLAYRLRPQERAGDAVVFIPFKRVVIFLVAAAGMFFFGTVGVYAMGSRTGLYIGFVLGFIIAYFIAQMLAEKTLRVGHMAKHLISYGAVATGLYVMLLIVTNVGFLGYIRNVPERHEIEGVRIQQNWGRGWGAWGWQQDVFIYDQATIAWVQEVHHGILAERSYLQRERWRDMDRRGVIPLNISYRLYDGRIVTRSYTLTIDFFNRWDINELLQSEPVVLAGYPALNAPETINFIEVTVRNDDYWAAINDLDFTRVGIDAHGIGYVEAMQAAVTAPFITVISDTQQVSGLAAAIQRDILTIARDHTVVWRDDIIAFVDTGSADETHRSGFMIQVHTDGYTAEWLRVNSNFPYIN